MVLTALSQGNVLVVLKASKEDKREMASFLASYFAVECFQRPDTGLKTRRKPECRWRLVLKPFLKGVRPKYLRASF
jgi:hypothetical protein